MTSSEIRQKFLEFFESKDHKIVPSAPIVSKDDPTLMFTNAGMNQFKDYFLGNRAPVARRVADTQKCLRVSGKHNDLEEVGIDSYHHTMFEMLGNWSFGDYFKKEAIGWAWELLTKEFGLDPGRLYATVFEGDQSEGLAQDRESFQYWENWLPKDRILFFGKKDNFWEMGETGPCGPCSEIHIDLRNEEDRAKIDGKTLVNADHPQVVELWNLVFIQFNRKADRSLVDLPEKHIDTGMGFERLCMALQGKLSNYDTDVFTPFIRFIEKHSGKKYGFSYDRSAKSDIAMRVVADHIRAVAFSIADGQLPGNTGAGYVIRRILRRAVRYYYSFLDIKDPFLFKLIPFLSDTFKNVFPELKAQEKLVTNIIKGEEKAFLRTLEKGLSRFEDLKAKNGVISGEDVFELYDTYGFPDDLTKLLASEKGWEVDEKGFEKALDQQKKRSRQDAQKEVGDWTVLGDDQDVTFIGYDRLVIEQAEVIKYRTVVKKGKEQYQIVLNVTPFYAESGGQAGDIGRLKFGGESIPVLDTVKENELIIHVVKKLPADLTLSVRAEVDPDKRHSTENNHTATHLMHAALHQVLGKHALQKGQDVDDKRLRFDFSHFQKVSDEELEKIEDMVNEKIRENIPLEEEREVPVEEAKASGAMMLFGEKYGDLVRVITFDADFSRELCGGTHVSDTGKIGLFKIVSESSVAAGIRRIEAVTAEKAEKYIKQELEELDKIRALFKSPQNVTKQVAGLQEENKKLKKELEKLTAVQTSAVKDQLKPKVEKLDEINFLSAHVPLQDSAAIKSLAFQLDKELGNAVIIFGAVIKEKPHLTASVSQSLVEEGLDAGQIVREAAKEIQGGGGGQPFFATAGGKDVKGIERALSKARDLVVDAIKESSEVE